MRLAWFRQKGILGCVSRSTGPDFSGGHGSPSWAMGRRESIAASSTPLRLQDFLEQASNMWQDTQQHRQQTFCTELALDLESWASTCKKRTRDPCAEELLRQSQ